MVTNLVKSCRRVVSSALLHSMDALEVVWWVVLRMRELGWVDGEGWFPQSWHYWATTPPTS